MKTPTRIPLHRWLWLAVSALLTANPASADLIHRYSFDEAPGATTASDSVGTAHGTIRMTAAAGGPVAFDGTQATLDGVAGYIDLPNGLVSGLTNVTFEMWVTWTSGGNWARIFDFGTNAIGEDVNGSLTMTEGGNYLFLTPTAGGTSLPRFASSDTQPGFNHEDQVNGTAAFPFATETHVAVTYGPNGSRLFINGEQQGANNTVTIPLSAIRDVNVWLGRANWNDPMFGGSYNEFRMHDGVLTLQQLAASMAGGPTVTNAYDPGAANSLNLTLASSMIAGALQTPQLSAGFANINGGTPFTIYGADVTITSSAPNIVAVGQLGVLQAVAPGTATITARLGTLSDSVVVTVTAGVASLVHRYSFNEAAGAATVVDLVGGAAWNASVIPPTTNTVSPVVVSNGQANFPGGAYQTAGYIDLPNGILSQNKTNVTFEFWFTWNGGGAWQRVFDFGNSLKGEDPHAAGNGLGYIMFTPARGGNGARTEFRTEAPHASVNNDAPANPAFTVGQEVHVVAIVAPGIQFSRLYLNGIPVATGSTPMYGAPAAPWQLNQMVDVNNWLGLAQWNDPPLNGSINEFRIHEGVLTDVNVALSRQAGPNALPVANPGSLVSVSLSAPALFLGNPAPSQAALLGTFQNVANVDVSGLDGVTFSSSDTNIFMTTARGSLIPRVVGTASLIASYGVFSATSSVSVLAPIALVVTNLPATLDAGSLNYTVPLLANFAGDITNIVVSAFTNGVTRSSSDPSVATITAAGVVTIRSPGTTTITSTYAGITNQSTLTVVTPAGFTRGTLVHRYSFSGAPDSTLVEDSVGDADGALVNLAGGSPNNNFNGTGQLDLGGGPFSEPPGSAYVNLSNGLVSSLSSVTIEGWTTWRGGANNQRFFDFGMSSGAPDGLGGFGEDVVANPGMSYLFISPQAGAPRFAIKQGTDAETPSLNSSLSIVVGNNSHFALVYDYPRGVVRLYINGQRAGTAAATLPLSVVDDRNNWIGRSQWGDPLYNGLVDEFRIYDGPMLDSDVAASFAAGPNALPVNRPTLSIGLSGGNILIQWSTNATGFAVEGSATVDSGYSTDGIPAPTIVGDQFQVSIPLGPNHNFYRLKQ